MYLGKALKDTPYAVTTPTGVPKGFKRKDLIGIPWRTAFALQADGWYFRSAIPWVKRSSMPESVTDRPTNALEYMFMFSKSERYYFDMDAIRIDNSPSTIERSKYMWAKDTDSKASKYQQINGSNRNEMYPINPNGRSYRNTDFYFQSIKEPHGMMFYGDQMIGIDVNPKSFKEAHFAVFPEKLIEPCIFSCSSEKGCCSQCGKPIVRIVEVQKGEPVPAKSLEKGSGNPQKGGDTYRPVLSKKTVGWGFSCDCHAESDPCVVLDPFMGAGTTGLVCEKSGRKWIGVELSKEYCEIIKKRLTVPSKRTGIFDKLFE